MIKETIETECDYCGAKEIVKIVNSERLSPKSTDEIMNREVIIAVRRGIERTDSRRSTLEGEMCASCEERIFERILATARRVAKKKGKK